MPFDVPFTLGPFTVGTDGALTPRAGERNPGFHVLWRGRQVHAWLEPRSGFPTGRLCLAVALGRIPSTASTPRGQPAARRAGAFAVAGALARSLAPDWRLGLRPDHTLAAEATRDMALPTSAVALIATLTEALLGLAPYLEVLDAAAPVLEVPPGGAGMASNWPG